MNKRPPGNPFMDQDNDLTLFVGGSRDGRRLRIPHEVVTAVFADETYERYVLVVMPLIIFVKHGMSDEEVIRQLIAGYKPVIAKEA